MRLQPPIIIQRRHSESARENAAIYGFGLFDLETFGFFPAVVEAKAETIGTGSNSWPRQETNYDRGPDPDQLPPFSMLKSDEDREKKAEHQMPGTYHVVANPSSFAGLEEYQNSHNGSKLHSKSRTIRSPRCRSISANERFSATGQDVYEDPETLILGTFEENVRKLPTLGLLNTNLRKSSTSSLTSQSPGAGLVQSTDSFSCSTTETSPILESTIQSRADQDIVSFYQQFVRVQINQVHRDSLGTSSQSGALTFPEVLDKHVDSFPPVRLTSCSFVLQRRSSPLPFSPKCLPSG